MGYGWHLQKHLDTDLIDQIEANGRVVRPKKHKPARQPGGRPASTYRAKRREQAKAAYRRERRDLYKQMAMARTEGVWKARRAQLMARLRKVADYMGGA